jgi:hypothetical protein
MPRARDLRTFHEEKTFNDQILAGMKRKLEQQKEKCARHDEATIRWMVENDSFDCFKVDWAKIRRHFDGPQEATSYRISAEEMHELQAYRRNS